MYETKELEDALRIAPSDARRIIEAHCRMVDQEFVAQYLKRLER